MIVLGVGANTCARNGGLVSVDLFEVRELARIARHTLLVVGVLVCEQCVSIALGLVFGQLVWLEAALHAASLCATAVYILLLMWHYLRDFPRRTSR
jgi:hypothetical protein